MAAITIYQVPSEDARAALARLADRGISDLREAEAEVLEILARVRMDGDDGVRELTRRFEGRILTNIEVAGAAIERCAELVEPTVREAIDLAIERVRAFHRRQVEPAWTYRESGVVLGQIIRPVARVGVYAPGGTARYPSSVVMNVVPARVAGVEQVMLATPSPTPEVLYAARASGVTRVFDIGGAQAIAALACGTETVPQVDMVVGPGNRWVTAGKRSVFGEVAIDMLAGPSEIVVVADEGARPEVAAADLLAQAEHDDQALAVLITTDEALARAVVAQVEEQIAELPRQPIARRALESRGAVFVVPSFDEAMNVVNLLAPEHLLLAVAEPDRLLDRVRAAGAVFLGYVTPVVAGDYVAGPSHTLPTGGSARFASPLGVYSFLTRTSVVRYGTEALRRDAPAMRALAGVEGLVGHGRTVDLRLAAIETKP